MIVALAGRPNVGKSSLFNRLIGKRQALVWDRPGVTRDLIQGEWKLGDGTSVELWDLAGWGKVGLSFQNLSDESIEQIDLILLVVDGSNPLTSEDFECFEKVRALDKPVFVLVNKADKKSYATHASEIYSQFKRDIIEVSAERKVGLDDLETAVIEWKEKNLTKEENVSMTTLEDAPKGSRNRVLIFGRPNVGKSSLMNALAGKEISFVSDQPGTTRDVIEHTVKERNQQWLFTDTAGVRKKAKVYGRKADPVEIFSVEKAIKALQKADYAILIVEAHPDAKLHTQDKKLLHLVRQSMVPTLLIVNKWDLVRNNWTEKAYREELKWELADLDYVPILFISARTGFHVPKIFQLLKEISQRVHKIPTPKLNQWLHRVLAIKPPRVAKKGVTNERMRTRTQYLHIQYAVQSEVRPMTFQFFCNAPHAVAEDDKRFLTKRLRQDFDLQGLPLKAVFRKKN